MQPFNIKNTKTITVIFFSDHPNSPGKRPTLHFSPLRHTFSTDSQERHYGFREYVESLHQNSKASLLYGKNNVVVQPVSCIVANSLRIIGPIQKML